MSQNLLRQHDQDERRRHPRYDVKGLHGVLNGTHPFTVARISLGGLMIRLQIEPNFNEVARIEVGLDRVVFRSRARVVYAGPDMASPSYGDTFYRVGLAFVDTPPDQQLRLERFIVREFPNSRSKPSERQATSDTPVDPPSRR
ncbi:MAG: PilZ domain-containing protein [Thermoanaerobaculia bacterium]|nr:PilZ domain-containing protein [Thermoanaerobaculia bacterium]